MPCTLNKAAWEKLIDEDIDWLDRQPDTLEAKHIRQILEWMKTHKNQAERIKEHENIIKDVHNLINTKGHVSKWKIYNWLEQEMR